METEFTPFLSFLGGGLIGLAAVLLMALQGRIAGATGILAGAIFPADAADRIWRVLFVAGMICGPLVYLLVFGRPVEVTITAGSLALLAFGGLLVGIGVSLGNGCTSGHGVCGLARLSGRSLAAVLTFMAATAVTVYVLRHVLGGAA